MKRKIVIFIIFFLIFIGIIALAFVHKPINELIPPSGNNPPVKTPQITSFYPDKGISYTINVESFNPPNELPLIKVNKPRPLTEEEVKQLAKTAGLDEENFNKIFNNNNQRLYVFNSNNAYLTVYADTGEVSYRNYESASASADKLSEDEIISKAKDFLVNKFSFRSDTLNLSAINHFSTDEYVTIKGPTQPQSYYEVNFAPVITDYKVVTTNPNQSPIKVTVADDGTIGKADLTLIYKATLSPDKYPIKSFSDIKDQINKAVIVQARTEQYHGQYFPTDSIKSIDVDHIEIAYLASDTNNSYYQPVFLLQGTAKSDKVVSEIKVSLYLPALKNEQ